MKIRTYPFTKDFQAPDENYYRIIAGNGYFFHVKTPFFDALVLDAPLRRPNRLPTVEEHAALSLNKLSSDDVLLAHSFFSTVRRKFHAEAYLRLFAHPIRGDYVLDAPNQTNHSASVIADATLAPDGYCEIGSIHAHPGSAFHSATDIDDERYGDGLHIVFGHVDQFPPEIVATLAVRGRRFTINPTDVLDLPYEYDGPWLDHINRGQQ
jgi:hypothetical protein